MLYYNKKPEARRLDPTMSEHHHHHHPEGHAHPPAAVGASILRLSAIERLAFVSVLIAVIWAAVYWAMH